MDLTPDIANARAGRPAVTVAREGGAIVVRVAGGFAARFDADAGGAQRARNLADVLAGEVR